MKCAALQLGLTMLIGAVVWSAGPAEAQQRDPDRVIKKRDRDGDRQLNREEWPGTAAAFKRADRNGDGFLTAGELKAHWTGAAASSGTPGAKAPKVVQMGRQGTGRCRNTVSDPSPQNGMVVDVLAPDCVFEGTTLFGWNADPSDPMIREVDMRGGIVWEIAVRDVLPSSLLVRESGNGSLRDKAISIMDVAALPNGNVLFNVRHVGGFEVTRSGRLVWQHLDEEMSHDLDRLGNGNTLYARAWVGRGEDHVREVTPGGLVVWSWNGLADYDRPPFRDVEIEGWMHVNAVTRTAAGRTFISIRNFDRTAEVHADGRLISETVYCGKLSRTRAAGTDKAAAMSICRPHDPEILDDDMILVPLPPQNRMMIQSVGAKKARAVFTRARSEGYWHVRDANRLPNGNLLLTGYDRIVEMTRTGETVWQLRVPGRPAMVSPSGKKRLRGIEKADLYKAQRIGPDGRGYGG